MDDRFIVMEVGQLEENVGNTFARCSGDGTIFFYIVVVHVCILSKAFSSFLSAVSEIIALILNRS